MTSADTTIDLTSVVDDRTLRHVMHASSVLRRSSRPEHILGALTSSTQLLQPAIAVWAGHRPHPGSALDEAIVFDPTTRSTAEVDMGAALDSWAPRLAEGRPPFDIDVIETPFAATVSAADGTRSRCSR